MRRGERGTASLFTFVVGLVVGVLVVGVVAPNRGTVRVQGAGDATSGASAAADAGGAASAGASAATDTGPVAAAGAARAGGRAGSAPRGAAGAASGAVTGATRPPGTPLVIGITYPDLTALRALGAEYNNGDVPKQWDAILDRWKREKVVPINGHPVQFVYDNYNVLDLAAQRASCQRLVNDAHAFIVIAVAYFAVGVECTAAENKVPTLTTDGPLDDVYQRGAPWLFSLQMSETRLLRNWIIWADKRGFVRGHRLGIYYEGDNPMQLAQIDVVKRALGALSPPATLADEQTTRQAEANGGPEDASAAKHFQDSKVDIALLMTSKGGFIRQAKAIGYQPTYIESDHLFGTSDVTTAVYDADAYDKTFGITGRRVGEPAGHIPEPPGIEDCLKNYERYTGTSLKRTTDSGHESAEYGYILYACDLSTIMLKGLQAAAEPLTARSFVTGVETIRNQPMDRFPDISFGPGKHAGVDSQRTVQWQKRCTCWWALGAFEPLYL